MPKKSARKPKVGRVVRRTLADGTVREYHYKPFKPSKNQPRVAPDSIEMLMRAYAKSPAWRGLAKSTQASRTVYLRELAPISHLAVRTVTRREVLTIRDAIAERGNGAAMGFIKTVSVLFDWAVEQGWLAMSPVYKIKPLPSGHWPEWTAEHAAVALQHAPERLRRVIILGLYTGQRRGDLCTVRWSDYDGQTIRFTQQKTGTKVVLQVHHELKAEMDSWPRDGDTILLNARGGPWAPNTLSKLMPKVLQSLGMPSGLNIHGMRKLFAAGMANNGATAHEIQANTGHKTLSMVQLYTASADQRKLAEGAVSKIQSHTIAKKPA